MKTYARLAAEALARQHHDGGDPADHGDVAEQRGVAVAHPAHEVARAGRRHGAGRRSPRLARGTFGAKLVRCADRGLTLHAIRHSYYYVTISDEGWLPTHL